MKFGTEVIHFGVHLSMISTISAPKRAQTYGRIMPSVKKASKAGLGNGDWPGFAIVSPQNNPTAKTSSPKV